MSGDDQKQACPWGVQCCAGWFGFLRCPACDRVRHPDSPFHKDKPTRGEK